MSRHLCLDCWRVIAPREALFRCPACAGESTGERRPDWLAPAGDELRPVRALRRALWRRLLTDDDGAVRCERHPEAEIRLHCVCGHPLSASAAIVRGKPVALGFAGPPGAGKTVLTITLIQALRADAETGARLSLLGVDGTEDRFRALAEGFLDRGRQPLPSPEERAHHDGAGGDDEGWRSGNFCWELLVERPGAARAASALLSVFDLAGETWRLPPSEPSPRFDRYLSHLEALVFLVDGAGIAADLGLDGGDAWSGTDPAGDGGSAEYAMLRTVIERIGERKRRVDIALVVSKADLVWDQPAWQALRAGAEDEAGAATATIEDLLRQTGRGDLVPAARQHFRRVELFAVSSLGFRPHAGDVEGDRLTRPIEPVGVTAPLLWLLSHRFPELGRAESS